MNYLFFDIECATCRGGKGKICEFGYYLCDENFNKISDLEVLINPDSPFDWYTLKNLLHFSKKEYKESPLFSEVYNDINKVLSKGDQIVFGQATKNDMKFLKDECDRYNLPYMDFLYCDVGIIFKNVFELSEPRSLEKMCEVLEVDAPQILHNASCDAKTTMLVLKKLCQKEKLDPIAFLNKYPACYQKFDFTEKTKKELKKLKKINKTAE